MTPEVVTADHAEVFSRQIETAKPRKYVLQLNDERVFETCRRELLQFLVLSVNLSFFVVPSCVFSFYGVSQVVL